MSELKAYCGRHVLVTLDSDVVLDGTLTRVGASWGVLENATLIPPAGEHVAMDGTVMVQAARVVWIQVV